MSNVAFNADGSLLAAGVEDSIVLWDVETLLPFDPVKVTERQVQNVLFHPQDTQVVFTLSGEEAIAWQWDGRQLETHQLLQPPDLETDDPIITGAAISPDGSLLMVICDQRQIIAWDTETGQHLEVPAFDLLYSESDPRDIYAVAFSPDGMYLAFGTGWGLSMFVVP